MNLRSISLAHVFISKAHLISALKGRCFQTDCQDSKTSSVNPICLQPKKHNLEFATSILWLLKLILTYTGTPSITHPYQTWTTPAANTTITSPPMQLLTSITVMNTAKLTKWPLLKSAPHTEARLLLCSNLISPKLLWRLKPSA